MKNFTFDKVWTPLTRRIWWANVLLGVALGVMAAGFFVVLILLTLLSNPQ